MAKIKSRSGAAPGAPKPRIEPRKTPALRRRGVKWIPVVIIVILAAVLTPMLLGRSARADRLRHYDRALLAAILPFSQQQNPNSPDSFVSLPEQLRQGTVEPDRLEEVATGWAEDFTEAGANVRALAPPNELLAANAFISQTLDLYAGVARQYVVLAAQQRLAERATGSSKRLQERQVTAWLDQIDGARTQAEAQLGLGRRLVDELKAAWGLIPQPEPEDFSGVDLPPDLFPDGGAHGG